MRAVWITRHAGPEALEVRETADPDPGPGQVRIRVCAAGLNFAEVMAAQGLYPDAPKPPCVVGYEVAGVIDALGEGTQGRAAGERVLALTHFGGHADVVCVPAEQALPMPDAMSFEEAAAMPVSYLTAYHMLFRVAGVRPGERVLVHMAAGGVGTAVLQLCQTVDGVVTFGTASAAKHKALRAEGCTHPIDYHTADYAAEVRRLTNGEGVDVVLDLTPMATAPIQDAVDAVRWGGTIVLAGLKGGRKLELSTDQLVNKALTVKGAFSVDAAAYTDAIKLIESGKFPLEKMQTHKYGLDDVEHAIKLLAGEVPGEDGIHVAVMPGL